MADHRVPLLGDTWRRVQDPERSRDPQVQSVLAGLRSLSGGPGPDATFRAELRAQLVAIAPRIVAEGEVDSAPTLPARAARTPVRAAASGATLAAAGRAPRLHLGVSAVSVRRVAAASTCAVLAMVALLGVALYLSRNTVPGDALYGLKRASENVQLAMDSNSEKPADLMRFAGRRVDEAQILAERNQAGATGAGTHAAGTISNTTAQQIQNVLASSDSDVSEASRLLGDSAVSSASAAPLGALTTWAPTQLARLKTLASTLGSDPAVVRHVASSAALVARAKARAAALGAKVGCGCLKSAPSDSLGPKPCSSCSTAPAKGTSSRDTSGKTGTQAPVTHGDPVNPGTGNPARSTSGPLGSVPTAPKGSDPTLPITVPTTLPVHVPTNSPTLPVSVDTCGVHVSVGGITVNLGSCKSS